MHQLCNHVSIKINSQVIRGKLCPFLDSLNEHLESYVFRLEGVVAVQCHCYGVIICHFDLLIFVLSCFSGLAYKIYVYAVISRLIGEFGASGGIVATPAALRFASPCRRLTLISLALPSLAAPQLPQALAMQHFAVACRAHAKPSPFNDLLYHRTGFQLPA
jgi:hypothetical protein